ncbi:hypothetical protein LPU83_pLPU83d_0930 (plasmid) [Rhizobium favelukesii]|uniref:TetR family transcriptional regulator n=1 Tax=Rhizobium favelukesii TaxID=348824 RepID=W6RQ36_9HYPH|nr:hypothetical protein LPU83_pLPU83d_0930 [Rhizobium favelukesii]
MSSPAGRASHNAPYKHFADKRELLAAVSAVGFELLAMRMAETTKELDSPRMRLAAIARAYVCERGFRKAGLSEEFVQSAVLVEGVVH